MKQYSLIVVLHICLLAVFSVGVYVLFRAELLFSTIIAFLFLSGTGIHLYHIQIKQLQVIRRLTDSLRYNDMTQTFRPPYQNKLMTEMTAELSETLQIFRARLLEEEVKHQYYETLLNKVDTAVLVTDMSGRIQWMNRAAIAQLGQTPQLPPELLFLHSGETQVMRIHRHGATLEMAVSSTLFMARGIEQRLISLKNIHSVLERNEMEAWQKLIQTDPGADPRNHELHHPHHLPFRDFERTWHTRHLEKCRRRKRIRRHAPSPANHPPPQQRTIRLRRELPSSYPSTCSCTHHRTRP